MNEDDYVDSVEACKFICEAYDRRDIDKKTAIKAMLGFLFQDENIRKIVEELEREAGNE